MSTSAPTPTTEAAMDTERKAFELTEPFTAEELIGLAESVRGRRRAAILAYANSLKRDAVVAELIEAAEDARSALLQCIDALSSDEQSHHDALGRITNALSRLGASA
ncbi:hypothetical protein ACQKIE_19170 [Luteibacter sp. NPDC031894]|uniref:hypothetical protein n=1 Tax=Luteibacter sp. NPDC031894 TaxID=3390572 RepID=UPI003CFFE34E